MSRWDDERNKARRKFRENIDQIKPEDIDDATNKGYEKVNQFGDSPPGSLSEIWGEVKLLIQMLRDYQKGKYRQVPWSTIAAAAAAVLYLVNPLDIIPDFIPIIGFLDDLAVLALCFKLIREDLIKYNDWLRAQEIKEDEIEDVEFEDVS